MFDPAELAELRERIREQVDADRHLLDELVGDIRALKGSVQRIYPRTTTAIAFVASDGGNNRLVFDPFYAQLVRVTDSYGKPWFVDVVSPTTDTDHLSRRQFRDDGTPHTPLGRMMRDLGVETLSGLCPFIPAGARASAGSRAAGPTWVLTYRDLCEWAVLYDRICYAHFGTHTLLVRDGLLRNTLFRGTLFSRWRQKVEEAMERIRREDRLRVTLVGMAKRSKMLDRYALAIATEELFPPGQARYVRIPPEIAAKTYRGIAGSQDGEAEEEASSVSRFAAGDLYFVRFGPHSGDPIWPVELFSSQADRAAEIFGLLLADAQGGFPVPFYPLCLQRAHEHAQVVDFDLRILQDAIFAAVRHLLPQEKQGALDALQLKTDAAGLRYG
jgi:hypothetical protein